MRFAAATTVTTIALFAALTPVAAGQTPTGGPAYGDQATTTTPAVPVAPATTGGVDPSAHPVPVVTTTPGPQATVGVDGRAVAPAGAPAVVSSIIAAGNLIARKPYLWGGGHRRWLAAGYDCSGSVSYALHGGGLLDAPLVSGDLAHWGARGPGSWVTIYANRGHVFMVVAGLRFDTSGQRQAGTRWQPIPRSIRGYSIRHPAGL